MMAKVVGIGGVFFKSKNPKALCEWYRDSLGLSMEKDFEGFIFNKSALSEGAYAVLTPFKDSTEYFEPSDQNFMINLIVDDVDGVLYRVKANGGKIVGEPEDTEFGRFGWILDPEGNKIELWKPL
jgi:predicted enzyme related to lactoylglutathione lyase